MKSLLVVPQRTFLTLVFALGALGAAAAERVLSIEELLALPERPTMEQVKNSVTQIDSGLLPVDPRNPDPTADQRMDAATWTRILLREAPYLIATLEKTYPGARFVFLGRDGLPWADVVDAFYISIGQPNRVIRMGISRPTLDNADDKDFTRLLRSHDFDSETIGKDHPYVFVDSVSRGFGSQGRRLMGTIFANWLNEDKNPFEIVQKVGMMGLQVSTFKGRPQHFQDRALYDLIQVIQLTNVKSQSANKEADGSALAPMLKILTISEARGNGNEAGYVHFMGAWNESYGTIRRVGNSRNYRASPGAVTSKGLRETVLWTQAQIWQFVNDGTCLQKVKHEAKKLDYEFPLQRPAPMSLSRATIKEIAIGGSEAPPRQTNFLVNQLYHQRIPSTGAGEMVLNFIENNAASDQWANEGFQFVTWVLSNVLLTDAEVKNLVTKVFELTTVTTTNIQFLNQLLQNAKFQAFLADNELYEIRSRKGVFGQLSAMRQDFSSALCQTTFKKAN